jgi:hypothetical protein
MAREGQSRGAADVSPTLALEVGNMVAADTSAGSANVAASVAMSQVWPRRTLSVAHDSAEHQDLRITMTPKGCCVRSFLKESPPLRACADFWT